MGFRSSLLEVSPNRAQWWQKSGSSDSTNLVLLALLCSNLSGLWEHSLAFVSKEARDSVRCTGWIPELKTLREGGGCRALKIER